MPVIETVKLSYLYESDFLSQNPGVHDINIAIEENQIIGIIGKTGSGKSTFAQILNGLIKPTSGKVFLNGKNIWQDFEDIREIHFKIGMAFQYPEYQLFAKTVYEDIAFGPKNQGLSDDEITERVFIALDFVGLPFDLIDKSPFDLSGGQKRRVAIAGIIAMQPQVLILDEPTAGLDYEGKNILINSIKNYHERTKNVIIFISHTMEDVAKLCDKVAVFHEGRVKIFDTPEKVFSNAKMLNEIGLEVPQITKIMSNVSEKGFPIGETVVTVDRAFDIIKSMAKI